jgi:two-component system phosphate regulon response regulator PhoB
VGDQRVLVVDDEADLRKVLQHHLDRAGYDVRVADCGSAALEETASFKPQVVILDWMLPDMSGIDVCRRVRADFTQPQPAIVVLTARAQETDRVIGLEAGADDYVVKPFSIRELMLRVNAQFNGHRGGWMPEPPLPPSARRARRVLRAGPLVLDLEGQHVYSNSAEVHLSPLELKLLVAIVEARGRVRFRKDLLETVWGYNRGISSRTLDTHCTRLRGKLGEAGVLIETVRGEGYRLCRRIEVFDDSEDAPRANSSASID